MMEWVDRAPDFVVSRVRFQQLLGYPIGHKVTGRAADLEAWVRAWYAHHGRPWMYLREARKFAIADGVLELEGSHFRGGRLLDMLVRAGAHGAVLTAVGAGPEVEEETRGLWTQGRPDESYFLAVYGSAVVESLIEAAGGHLRPWADAAGANLLPHYSPGYEDWDMAEQSRLLALVADRLPAQVTVLDSGALLPRNSQLAVFGVAPGKSKSDVKVPCQNCSLATCDYRRAPMEIHHANR